jgi:hypothetical protein
MSELTKEYFDQMLSGLATKDDLVSELKPIKHQLTRIEEKVDRISTRTHEDDVATMKDVVKLTKRVKSLEETASRLKPAHAS